MLGQWKPLPGTTLGGGWQQRYQAVLWNSMPWSHGRGFSMGTRSGVWHPLNQKGFPVKCVQSWGMSPLLHYSIPKARTSAVVFNEISCFSGLRCLFFCVPSNLINWKYCSLRWNKYDRDKWYWIARGTVECFLAQCLQQMCGESQSKRLFVSFVQGMLGFPFWTYVFQVDQHNYKGDLFNSQEGLCTAFLVLWNVIQMKEAQLPKISRVLITAILLRFLRGSGLFVPQAEMPLVWMLHAVLAACHCFCSIFSIVLIFDVALWTQRQIHIL